MIVLFLCTLQYDNLWQWSAKSVQFSNEFSQMGECFQDEHRFAKMFSQVGECSPIWEKISQVERAPLLFVMPVVVGMNTLINMSFLQKLPWLLTNSIQFTFISNNKVKSKIYKDDFPGNT